MYKREGNMTASLPVPLRPLAAYRQWITYRLQPKPDGRTDKIPTHPGTGHDHDAHDPAAWTDYDTAAGTGRPVGFVFTDNDPFFFLDIDHSLSGGVWSDLALDLFNRFRGCAVEISQSGTGAHVIGRIPVSEEHRSRCKPHDLEFYTTKRFMALGGQPGAIGDAGHTPDPGEYTRTIREYFPPSPGTTAAPEDWTDGPCPEWTGPTDDADLIARMLRARSVSSVLGGGVTPAQLWEADSNALAVAFPDDRREFDWSRADSALCSHLAFWTGKDCERMDRLFRQSGLMRDKWGRREDYRRRTVLAAVGMCRNVYSKGVSETGTPPTDVATGYQYLTPYDQQNHFQGCVYIRDSHRIFCPDGGILKPEQFRSMYGGHVFSIDASGEKTSRNAWEVFTESQAVRFPKVARSCFRPSLKPGEIIEEEGDKMVNVYTPCPTPRKPGDPGPFLDLVARLLPDQRDRGILLAYAAAVVQYPGRKFQWAPLLQGTPGNGKSFVGMCIAQAVGWKYSHIPDAQDIGNKFNAWLQGKLFILVEEIYARDINTVETMKWMITNTRVPVQDKGVTQNTGENVANFYMCSNHKGAIPKTKDDRRYCVFHTAQQSREDMIRAGMTGAYFPKLWDWAKAGGWAVINDYLRSYTIPDELNPATSCAWAPETTSTAEAIEHGRGAAEQEVMEAVAEGVQGFRNGWISSLAVNELFSKRRIPRNKWRTILGELGYVPHPGLPDGRVNNPVMYEGNRKPRLYVRNGHPIASIVGPEDIRRRYVADQGWESAAEGPGAAGAVGM